jgi:hypothetical protein
VKKVITLDDVKEVLAEVDPTFEKSTDDDTYRTALVLFSALFHGTDTEVLARFTSFPREFVETIRQRMIQAELWTETDVLCDHWFIEENVIDSTAILLDQLIAQGEVVRRWAEDEGQYRYWHADYVYGEVRTKHVVM